jgi:hypothetical protein
LAAIAGVVYVKNQKKEQEQAQKEEKKDEKQNEIPVEQLGGAAAPGAPAGPTTPNPEPKEKIDPKGKDPNPNPPIPVPGPTSGRPALTLGKLKAYTVGTPSAKPELTDKPRAGGILDVPLASVKRVFPPADAKTGDTCVLVQTVAGVSGKGEKLALDSYTPAGTRARLEYDGDGSQVPIADVFSSSTGLFFLASNAGKLSVWSVVDKKPIAEGISPYAEKPEHAKAGLAAAFFAADPNQVVTVSTAGAVLLYDLKMNKAVSEFIPPNGTPGTVALSRSVAKASDNKSVVVAVAGVLYQLQATPGLQLLRKHDLEGDVGRSLGIGASGSPGRLLYAFETTKKQKAILCLPLGEKAERIIYSSPVMIGDPKGAFWAHDTSGGIITDQGVLWFEEDEGKIQPMAFVQPTAGAGKYAGNEQFFWYVVAHPKDATKSVLVALSVPFNDFTDYLKFFPANKPLRTLKIDGNGLSK